VKTWVMKQHFRKVPVAKWTENKVPMSEPFVKLSGLGQHQQTTRPLSEFIFMFESF